MKKFALAAAFSLSATALFAGNPAPAPEEMDVMVVEEDTSGSAGGIIVPIIAAILIAAALAAD